MKTWLTKLEADNRKLREEVAEVKALRRERRESDFEAARIRNQLNRLEEQNASLAAETAQKHAEWEQERGRLQREAERHQAAQDENEAPKRAEALVATRQAKRGNRKQPASPEEVENTAVTSTVNGIEPVLQKTHVAPKATRKPRKANAKLPDAENSTGTAAQQPTNNDTESPSQQPKSASAAEPHELPETRTNGRPRRAAQRTEWWKINGTGLPAAASTEEDAMDDESENEPHGGKQRTTTSRKAKHVREPPEEPMPAENRENVLPERGAEKEVPGQAPRKRKRKAIEDEDVAQEPDERDVPAPNKLTKPTAKSKKSEDQATASEQDFSNNVGQESTETQVEVSEATSSKQGTKTTKGARKATAKEIPIAVQPTGPISVEDILGLGTTSCKEDPKSKSKTARAKKPTKNGTSVVAESAESEGPVLPTLPNGNETSEPAAEGDEVTGKPTKKRKLNLAKKAKDEEDTENENPAKAKMQKSVSNKEAAVTVPESTVPAPVAAAAEPSSQTAASSSTSLSTSMTGAPTSSTAALGFGSRSLPNINNSGRMEFRKRPGLDPDRMKAILSGYGLQWSDRSEMR
ncbi:uncharacterized protein EV422DRAFT_175753 [Fimicolochytrium jonesii]|uniref:uncharacterized protein n=1 Tax=Fimicolochytrium jonesii TaxID=1396493 RepID=UPI0022FDD551|nr:uncharacterized protein EV422DRAFT_175753 [Fimicolochytrium jonesii]KAI8818629.1 hypothetical protein EV422DRAFT_175753 [Fimicolochytrium jonesii]